MLLSPFTRVPFAERLATYMTLLRCYFTPENPAEKYARTQRVVLMMTWHDISWGVRGQCSECPLALMLKRYLKEEYTPLVGLTVVSMCHKSDREFSLAIATPVIGRDFIRAFDDQRRPTPIQFPLDIPEVMLKPAFLNSQSNQTLTDTTNPKADHDPHTTTNR